jgi:hypothetical protein
MRPAAGRAPPVSGVKTVSAYFEAPPAPAGPLDPADVVVACIESGARALLLDDGALPPAFFDLSTGVAGALVQRLTTYGVRMAAVVPDPSIHSRPFQDFAREAGTGRQFRFFPDREQAIAWLAAE